MKLWRKNPLIGHNLIFGLRNIHNNKKLQKNVTNQNLIQLFTNTHYMEHSITSNRNMATQKQRVTNHGDHLLDLDITKNLLLKTQINKSVLKLQLTIWICNGRENQQIKQSLEIRREIGSMLLVDPKLQVFITDFNNYYYLI